MNLDQLMGSLSENDPNEGTVLGLVYRKRRAARQRMYAASGGLAVVVVAILGGFLLRGVSLGGAASSSSSSAEAAAGAPAGSGPQRAAPVAPKPALAPNASPAAAGSSGSTASCAGTSLKAQLAAAVRQGASIIVGYGTVGSTSAAGSPGGLVYYQVTLRSVQTLAGPAIKPGSTTWVQGAPASSTAGTSSAGSSVTPEGQSLWAPDGELFGIVSPGVRGATPAGQKLRLAPVIGGQVIFSSDECWNATGVPGHTYFGPVGALPSTVNGFAGSGSPSQGAVRGLYAVPLADVKKLVPTG